MKNSLKSAIKAAGGLSAFAEAVGASSTHAVRAWFLSRVPAEYCPAIEAATGVRCEELRPDVQWGVLRGTVQAAATSSQPEAPDGQALGATEE